MSKLLAGGETHSSSGLEKLSDTKLSDEEWPMSLRGMGLDVTKMSMSTIFSHSSGFCAYRMLSFDFDVNGFQSAISRHLLTV